MMLTTKRTTRTELEIFERIVELKTEWQELAPTNSQMSANLFALREGFMGELSGLYWILGHAPVQARAYARQELGCLGPDDLLDDDE